MELYGDEGSQRKKLAEQLRNQNNEFYQELRPSIYN